VSVLRRYPRWALALALAGAVLATWLVSTHVHRAGAAGIPASKPLVYAGLLTDKAGAALSGTRKVQVALLDKQGGKQLCTSSAQSVDLSASKGRFRLALPDACVTVVQANTDLWVQVTVDGATKLERKIGAVPYAVEVASAAPPACPPGYTRASKTTGFVLCQRGEDQMVKVGNYWIDRYEVSVVNAVLYNKGACDGKGTKAKQYGEGVNDWASSGFSASGNWTTTMYACYRAPTSPGSWRRRPARFRASTTAAWREAPATPPPASCARPARRSRAPPPIASAAGAPRT